MKIEFEIDQKIYDRALRYTLDPVQHLQTVMHSWAQLAEQEHKGFDVLQLPTLAEKSKQIETDRAAVAKQAELANVESKIQEAAQLATQQLEASKRDTAEAQQRQLEINAAAKAMLQAAMPDLRAMVEAELAGKTK